MSSLTATETSCSYICEICGYIIEDLSDFKLHLKGHHEINDIDNDKNNCLTFNHYQQQQLHDKKIEDCANHSSLDYQNCK